MSGQDWIPNFTVGPTVAGQSMPRYCNTVHIFFSQWDVSLEFSLQAPSLAPEEGAVAVTRYPIDRLVMSPQHAKALAELLRHNMEKFEEQYGPISDPKIEVEAIGTKEAADDDN